MAAIKLAKWCEEVEFKKEKKKTPKKPGAEKKAKGSRKVGKKGETKKEEAEYVSSWFAEQRVYELKMLVAACQNGWHL